MEQASADEAGAANPAEYWVKRVQSAGRYRLKDTAKRAPYKPLLLLWLIGRLARGQPPSVSFGEAEKQLGPLLNRYRVASSKPKVEHPFVYLASDPELWGVRDSAGNDVRGLSTAKKLSPPFLREEATGKLAPGFALALRDPAVCSQVVNALLEMEFPETQHDGILQELELDHLVVPVRSPRDPKFRAMVLRAYEDRCAFCGYDLRLGGSPVGIDAAHVQMRKRGGPDRIENGLALCVQHHRLFDFGALGLDHDHRILVSEHLNLSDQDSAARIRSLVGTLMRKPLRRYRLPAPERIEWHKKNLFRHPAR